MECIRCHKESETPTCEVCRQKRRDYYLLNKGKFAEIASKTYQKNKEAYSKRARKNKLKKYGIDEATFEAMNKEQEGRCAICNKLTETILRVDHNHTTGKVRGLLCHNCNALLGHAKETISILDKAIQYLEKDKTNAPF